MLVPGSGGERVGVGAWPGQCETLATGSHWCEAVGEAGCNSQPSLGCEVLAFGVYLSV